MKNETPMYLVPGRITDEQASEFLEACGYFSDPSQKDGVLMTMAISIIGTAIQPCADVRAIAWEVYTDGCDRLFYGEDSARECAANLDGIVNPLVRRTDMEAQVARVAAEKDAEIAQLRNALARVERIGNVVERKGATTGPHWIQFGVALSIARAALNEGEAG